MPSEEKRDPRKWPRKGDELFVRCHGWQTPYRVIETSGNSRKIRGGMPGYIQVEEMDDPDNRLSFCATGFRKWAATAEVIARGDA